MSSATKPINKTKQKNINKTHFIASLLEIHLERASYDRKPKLIGKSCQ